MINFSPNTIANRRPAQQQAVQGTELQLTVLPGPPPGPWLYLDSSGDPAAYAVEGDDLVDGRMIVVQTNNGPGAIYNEFYVYVAEEFSPVSETPISGSWKKVDLNWPKIDPNTGQLEDQYLEWYSPLAE